mgnify:CR=1 FL=1
MGDRVFFIIQAWGWEERGRVSMPAALCSPVHYAMEGELSIYRPAVIHSPELYIGRGERVCMMVSLTISGGVAVTRSKMEWRPCL